MATWQEYIDQFPASYQGVISVLETTYDEDFSISDFTTFAAQSNTTITGQLDSLDDGHDLLLALADFYLAVAADVPDEGEGALGPWELMGFKLLIDESIPLKSLQEYFDSIDVSFEDFQSMSAASLAAAFGPAQTAEGFWASFVFSLRTRISVLDDTEFGGFLQSLPLEERTSVEAFIQLVGAGFDEEALDAMSSAELAGKLKSLNSNPLFRYQGAQKVVVAVRNLIAAHCPDDQMETRFLASQGSLMTPALKALYASLVTGEVVTTVREIGGLGLDAVVSAINGWNSGHLYFHGQAARLLSDFHAYRRNAAEAAKLPVTPFAFQIRPTNDDARPLGGLLVKVVNTTADPDEELGTRMLDFNGIAYVQYEGSTESAITLTFEVMTAEEESLVTSGGLSFDPETDTSIEVAVAVPALPVNTGTIADLATALSLTIPSGLSTWLAAEEIATLDDIRRMGGLAKESATAVQENLALCQQLDGHALLEMIVDDADLRQFLITAGYSRPSAIAAKTRAGFVTELVGEEYGEVTLAGIHLKAGRVGAVLSHLLLARGAGHASKYKGEVALSPSLSELLAEQCDCEECRSGVSPLAYLAALLDYGTKHIVNDSAPVDVDWFQDTFHQGFCELPANCAAVEKKVCQVRIAIEVMRLYLGSVDIAYVHRKSYLETTYGLLLNQSGVTVEEVRLAASAAPTDALVKGMASRMGIAADKVAEFYLDSSGLTPTLTEDSLELLFGFQSTLRNPYSDGLKVGDSGDLVLVWEFEGVQWGRNTDADGFLYLKLVDSTTDMVEVYRDASRGTDDLVAWGTVSTASPRTAMLVQINDSGLSGRIELDAIANNSAISVSVVPRLLAWRFQQQRSRWASQDWPTANTFFRANRNAPIVEPDWMGPDDIRNLQPVGTDNPYSFWVNRRSFLDGIESIIRGCEDDVSLMFDEMDGDENGERTYTKTTNPGTVVLAPWDGSSLLGGTLSWEELFDQLTADLQNPANAAAARATIENDMHLSLEGFARVHALFQKYLAAAPSAPEFTTEEYDDLVDILMQAVKVTFYGDWIVEEDAAGITLTSATFWQPIHEPREGKWNSPIAWQPFYAAAPDMPFVDPVEMGLTNLPDAIWGAPAIALYEARVTEVADAINAIFDARNTGTGPLYHRMLEEALGTLPTMPFADDSADLPDLLETLDGNDANEAADALAVVNEVLFLTEAEFRDAMVVVGKEIEETVTDADYEKLAKVLVNAWRRAQQWDVWQGEEATANLDTYWHAYKQKLNKWRSSKALRTEWLAGLAFYSRIPIVDPDLIHAGDFVNPEFNSNIALDNPAYVLWRDRRSKIEAPSTGWLAEIEAASLSTNISTIVGITTGDITDLRDRYEQDQDVSARLAQLNLTPARLALIAKLVDIDPGWSDGDLDAFRAIMVQIQKERHYGAWNIEEREDGITLGPDFFQPPYANHLQYHQYLENILVPWRTSAAARRDWQERLDARIDQAQALADGLKGLVKATEDRVLIQLRDALVKNSPATGDTLEEKGEYLTEKLFLDFRTQCCNETTRVAQAIETLQVLYFSIRTGTIVDDYPDLEMDNDDWDEDWKWLGSYATWRSLMFVYMYPENVLLPSLKERKSGKLSSLMASVRDASRFTPDMACEVLHDYEEYLKDMADLRLQATVTTSVHVREDGCGLVQGSSRVLDFHFALGWNTGTVYLSTVDAAISPLSAQSTWEAVPDMVGIYKIIGATVFMSKRGTRYVYLFSLKSKANDQPDLVVNRLNLETMRWDSDLGDLKVPVESKLETWTAILAERPNETDPIYLVGTSYFWKSSWGAGNEVIDVGGLVDSNLHDRHVVYNWLDDEGVSWEASEWPSLGFLWMSSFNVVGAFLSREKFLCVLAAIRYIDNGDWHLGYHTFYHGNRFSQRLITRVLPQAIELGPSTNLAAPSGISAYVSALFDDFQRHSARIRSVPIGPAFKGKVNLLKNGTGIDRYEFHYNIDQGGLRTHVLTFDAVPTWYLPPLLTQLSPGTTVASSPTPPVPKYHRSLGFQVITHLPSLFDVFYIGPAFDHRQPAGTASVKRTIQMVSLGREMVDLNSNLTTQPLLLNLRSVGVVPVFQHPTPSNQATRKNFLRGITQANLQNRLVNRSYLQEAYYLLPMHVAMELQRGRYYEEALEVFRLVYDYTLPLADRKIYYGLVEEESIQTSFANVSAWLDDPENPHTIAGMRANSHTRFVIFSIVRCMLEMADQEFTTDSPESVPRARTLYLAARELIQDEIYAMENEGCGALLASLDAEVTDAGWLPEWLRLKTIIAGINSHEVIDAIVNGTGSGTYPGGIVEVFDESTLNWEEKIMAAEALYQAQVDNLPSSPNRLCNVVSDWSIIGQQEVVLGDDDTGTGMNRMSGLAGDAFLSNLSLLTAKTVGELLGEDDEPWLGERLDYGADAAPDLSLSQQLRGTAGYYEAYYGANPLSGLRNAGTLRVPFLPLFHHYFCVPQNPVPFNLLLHAELNLFKIRHCRNIAGIHRELDPYAAPTDTTSGMPVIGADGQISFPGAVAVPATPYRYEVVLARAKELAQMAAQAEAQLLNTLEKLDAERYSLLRARQDLGTAKATVKLQDLRVKESEDEVDMAEMQQERAQFQVDTYEGWIEDGLSGYEKAIVAGTIAIGSLRAAAILVDASYQSTYIASQPIMPLALTQLNIFLWSKAVMETGVATLQASVEVAQVLASWEQRKRDYTFQAALGEFDVRLAGQQIKLANDRLRITGQERAIAEMQARHAEETLEFLRTKFTNAELYQWMSGVLQRVYNFYLQHATSMAKVAQQQLAFERQETPANLIQDDYWSPPSDSASVPGVSAGSAVDRRGLTGSARLQMDLTKLDLYAFETEKRKQQLTKTMSLAQLFPAEFETFRQTGVLSFRTRMEWFDRDFPGHYLRLIKRVRTSVIALVPPGEGIRARLATTGVSRVVVGGDTFQTIVTRRGSESVSLTSPIEATGLFELLPDRGDMLYPFEGMGVDAPWEFRMFRAANPINFNTIADVLVTFEYTALESFDYERQVIDAMDPELHGERAFSFKYLFPDQWYDLKNATVLGVPAVVDFELRDADFPALGHLVIEHLTMILVTKEPGDAENRRLELWKPSQSGAGGLGVANQAGVISTRSGTATAWSGITGSPVGRWRLNCSGVSLVSTTTTTTTTTSINDPVIELLGRIDEPLVDILLIVSYKGDSPGYYR